MRSGWTSSTTPDANGSPLHAVGAQRVVVLALGVRVGVTRRVNSERRGMSIRPDHIEAPRPSLWSGLVAPACHFRPTARSSLLLEGEPLAADRRFEHGPDLGHRENSDTFRVPGVG